MKELKTLKDLNFYECDAEDIRNLLKQEAIKWVKGCDSDNEESIDAIGEPPNWRQAFLNFFNLTKEDLEEKEC